MSTFENGQKRRKVDVLGDRCGNKSCCIWDTLHRIKILEQYDVPFLRYLGLKWTVSLPYYFISIYGYGVPSFSTMLLAGGPWEDVDDPDR